MAGRPNVLWVTLESVRADHTSMYGYERETTPNLRVESERNDATVFTTPVSQSMWTPASTASILTGTYLSTHRLGQDGRAQQKLRSDVETLPQRLVEGGYETALFTPNAYIGPATGLDRGFETVDQLFTGRNGFLPWNPGFVDNWTCALRRLLETDSLDAGRLRNDIRHNATSLVPRRFRRWLAGLEDERPFFAYAHLHAPHHPYLPPARVRGLFTDDIEIDTDAAYALVESVYDGSDALKRRMARGLSFETHEWEAIRAMYDAEIRFADEVAGELIRLARSRSDRDLVVVVTGDHGELFGEQGLLGHNLLLHDGLIRVPLVVTGVDSIVDTPETLTQHIDVTYTLASLTDTLTGQFQGRDIRSPERQFGISQRGIALIDAYRAYDPAFNIQPFDEKPLTAVRTPSHKYIQNDSTGVLYELPDEATDVGDENPAVLQELSAICTELGIEWTFDTDGERVEFDEKARKRLRDLGYVAD